MGRKHFKDWPACLEQKSIAELRSLLRGFQIKAEAWPNIRKACIKSARLVEKEIARREIPAEE